jgi:hypothetical protein
MRWLAQHLGACLGLGLRMDRLNIRRTADLQTDEGLEWIASESAGRNERDAQCNG